MIIIVLLLLLAGVLLARTIHYRKQKPNLNNTGYSSVALPKGAAERLSSFIQLETVTYNDFSRIDIKEHRKIEKFFKKNFPSLLSLVNFTKLNDFAYIFRWEGKNKDTKPVLFMAHFDVVPAQDGAWEHPPFSGDIDGGQIWGRGTLDTKSSLLGILESAETLAKGGFTPETTLYFAFGGDEEIMGLHGAVNIVKYFEEENISFSWVLDEGSIIADNMLTMVSEPIALIGIAEKGFANINLSARATPGHASMPPDHTASGLVSRAVCRLEQKPFPVFLTKTVRSFLKALIPHVSFPLALVFANLWLFGPLVKLIFKKSPTTAAMVRTTQAATVLKGSGKDNILPDIAEAIVNVRILPGTTKTAVLKRMKKVIRDPQVEAAFTDEKDASNPVPESSIKGNGYRAITSAVAAVYPQAVTAPFLVTATTDSRHYKSIADNIYRFVPMVLTGEDLKKIHGFNESISIENYTRIINFFTELIKTL